MNWAEARKASPADFASVLTAVAYSPPFGGEEAPVRLKQAKDKAPPHCDGNARRHDTGVGKGGEGEERFEQDEDDDEQKEPLDTRRQPQGGG